jgi:hypothetical protein
LIYFEFSLSALLNRTRMLWSDERLPTVCVEFPLTTSSFA